ncbi:ABC transporter substrate-binding protein [Nakamurella flavida]|uniref:ABC transporter substrate-binding protein n=1 Tax=Nakamurella flavida TaxID=363630 RepID=A0A939C079_9ACTN|nr:ABC transporter substrate-binding protein [Nakamurella flavida]MBM9476443.1 ABC transporter substrate-binding protein [Nakamurella flavida]MDP9779456.1 putative spermidine/putrescine transport system substrate-binding protein [Nakamurella flavida]
MRLRTAARRPTTALALGTALTLLTVAGCGSSSGSAGSTAVAPGSAAATTTATGPGSSSAGSSAATSTAASTAAASGSPGTTTADWDAVLAEANGQTVNWYMYGGDDTLNTFVTGYVADELAAAGVTLNQVKITDTADAVNKVLGDVQAGATDSGAVDLVWVNGENFATGVQADLWECGWDTVLPNSRYVDFADPAVASDFGTPVDGCEAVWQSADSALVYDSAVLSAADVASVDSLFAWSQANPGLFTYPAPPDFTGSMAVRTFLYDAIGGPSSLAGPFDEAAYTAAVAQLWPRLTGVAGSLWRGGETYPASQEEVETLYGNGEISAFLTYGPGAVGDQVEKGLFPETTREAVLAGGNIGNRSFVAIPANAANAAGAKVLANVLQDPETQLALYEAEGIYPGIDLTRTDADVQARFAAVPLSPSVLPLEELTRDAQPELAPEYVARLEQDWTATVLQQG